MNQVKHEVKNEVDMKRIKEGEEFSKNFQLFPNNDNKLSQISENTEKTKKTSKWAKYLSDNEENNDE